MITLVVVVVVVVVVALVVMVVMMTPRRFLEKETMSVSGTTFLQANTLLFCHPTKRVRALAG